MANSAYNPKDILQQEFKTKMCGYSSLGVDGFLDNTIRDYEIHNKELPVL